MINIILISFLFFSVTYSVYFLKNNPQFGGKFSKSEKQKFASLTNWSGKVFTNQSVTTMNVNLKTLPDILKKQFTNRADRAPKQPLKIEPFDLEKWSSLPEKPKFIWYGHAVLLIQLSGKNILIDPMFGPDASPIGPIRTKRYSENTLEIINQLPQIDLVLLTHDHYDHLDYQSIQKLKSKVSTFYAPIGVKRHLIRWGIPPNQITEFHWWQEVSFDEIQLTFTPTRHFSGRGLSDRAKSLWGGWVLKTTRHSIYVTGDSGYDSHFTEVGDKIGPFDWTFVECGQYNKYWEQIHMMPEHSAQAVKDSRSLLAIPIHWGGFTLSLHPWTDPIERFTKKAEEINQSYCTPKLGEIIVFGEISRTKWWETLY